MEESSESRQEDGLMEKGSYGAVSGKPDAQKQARCDGSGEADTELSEEILAAPLVHGRLWKAIWLMSWPLLISTLATSVVGLVDVQVSGHIGRAAQAAVGLSEMVIFVFMIFILSIGVGTTAFVSREFGEGNSEGTVIGTSQSLLVSVMSGVLLTLLSLTAARFLLPLFGKSPEVIELCSVYISIYGFYMLPFSLINIAAAAFRAIGDARTPLLIILVEVMVNIAGDYLTVFYDWPVPGLGILGIAWSAVVSAVVAAAVTLLMLARSPLKGCFSSLKRMEPAVQRRILGIGLPSAIQRFGWTGSVFAVFFILSRLPEHTAALAAWTVGMRVEGLLFMPLMALSLAVSSIVGQNLGAGKEDRAVQAGWKVCLLGVVLMIFLSACIFLGADDIASMMSHDADTIAFSSSYLRINALCEPFLAVSMILMGAMQGAGDTKMPMWISLFCNWVVRLPVAWCLALTLSMGTDGVWYAMLFSVVVGSLLCVFRFRSGNWLKVRI